MQNSAYLSYINIEDTEQIKLLTNEENINLKNRYGKTALMISITKNDIELAKHLLLFKLNLEEICNEGYTAFMYSLLNKSSEFTQLLIQKGCNLNTVNQNKDLDLLDYCINSNIPNLVLTAKNIGKSQINVLKCRNCNETYSSKNENLQFCDKCIDNEMSGFLSETKRTNRFKPIASNETEISKKTVSVSLMRCPGCKEQRKMTKDNCENCNRKSPLMR